MIVTGADPEGNPLTFTLSDDDDGKFDVALNNNVRRLAPLPSAPGTASFTVRATDPGGLYVEQEFTVTVVNVAPTDITLDNNTVAEDVELGVVVGALSATDPEMDVVTFSLVDDSGGLFGISGNNLIVLGVLDFETSISHNVTVRATDSNDNTYDEVFSISVTDVAETPPDDPLPPGDDIPDDEDNFDTPPYSVDVDGGVKLAGKKKNNGSIAKFLHDISDDIALEAGRIYTMNYDPDWSQMEQLGSLAMVGFLFKVGNDFYIAGLRGDGSTGVHVYQVQGENLWNQTTGFATIDDGAAANGTRDGPNWFRWRHPATARRSRSALVAMMVTRGMTSSRTSRCRSATCQRSASGGLEASSTATDFG